MTTNLKQLAQLSGAFALVLTMSCGVKSSGGGSGYRGNSNSGDQNGDQDGDDQTPPADTAANTDPNEDQKPAALLLQAGVKNYAEISATMSVLTGVSPNNAAVKAAYDGELSTSLPAGNDIQAFLGSHQVAVTKLAVEYCDALFEDATLRAQVIPGFNFAAAPSAAFTPTSKALVAKSLIDRFWGVNLADRPGSADMQPMTMKLLDDILVGKTLTDVNVTKNSIKGVCTALLASAPVTLF